MINYFFLACIQFQNVVKSVSRNLFVFFIGVLVLHLTSRPSSASMASLTLPASAPWSSSEVEEEVESEGGPEDATEEEEEEGAELLASWGE